MNGQFFLSFPLSFLSLSQLPLEEMVRLAKYTF